ncbi:MAG TPA: ATP-binding cassette domain-containing protein [Dehalococcoidia bacterium]|nr:ATP-binding cassette domain-containing protein [Dehalococcoidia bacterium]
MVEREFTASPESPSQTATLPAIELRELTKFYGNVRGVEEIDLTVHPQEIFGFLGPNGTGKTTTIRTNWGFRSRSSTG